MNSQDQIAQARAARTIQNTQYASSLAALPEFKEFMEKGPETRITNLIVEMLQVKREDPRWREHACDTLVAIQECMKNYMEIFGLQLALEKQARKALDKLSHPVQ